jgi:cytochrome bd-type quinol oxidase subunit 2
MRNLTDDAAMQADKRRRVWIAVAAVSFPLVLMAVGSTGHPELGFALIALIFPALFVYGQIHGRRTREGIDERARDQQRRAASFSWVIMAVVLTATTAWMNVRHGVRAAEPYLFLGAVLLVSYLAALLWRRWRD